MKSLTYSSVREVSLTLYKWRQWNPRESQLVKWLSLSKSGLLTWYFSLLWGLPVAVYRSSPPHPPVSISTHGLQLLLTIFEKGCISSVNPPVLIPCLGFPSQRAPDVQRWEESMGRTIWGRGRGAAPRPGLKPQSVALSWPRSRATEQKPGSLVTPTYGRPPQHSQPRNQAAAKARAWACTGLPTTTCKIFYSSPAPHRSRLQPAT